MGTIIVQALAILTLVGLAYLFVFEPLLRLHRRRMAKVRAIRVDPAPAIRAYRERRDFHKGVTR